MAFEKKFNKILLGLVIGTTIAGVAGAKTQTWQKVAKKQLLDFCDEPKDW